MMREWLTRLRFLVASKKQEEVAEELAVSYPASDGCEYGGGDERRGGATAGADRVWGRESGRRSSATKSGRAGGWGR
jgi:hypothetical protein